MKLIKQLQYFAEGWHPCSTAASPGLLGAGKGTIASYVMWLTDLLGPHPKGTCMYYPYHQTWSVPVGLAPSSKTFSPPARSQWLHVRSHFWNSCMSLAQMIGTISSGHAVNHWADDLMAFPRTCLYILMSIWPNRCGYAYKQPKTASCACKEILKSAVIRGEKPSPKTVNKRRMQWFWAFCPSR